MTTNPKVEGLIAFYILQLYDYTTFYLAMNQDFVFDQVQTDLQYLKSNWQMLGRPTMILPIYHWMAGNRKPTYIIHDKFLTCVWD